MKQIVTIFTSLIVMVVAIPVEHDLFDLSQLNLGHFAAIAMTPQHETETSGHISGAISHITDKSSKVASKLQSGVVHGSLFVESQKDAVIGAALLPIEVGAKSAAVGGAIPAAAAVKGSIIGSAIATPIILKAYALPGVAATKTAAVLAVPSLLTHNLHTKVQESTHRFKNALRKGATEVFNKVGLFNQGAIDLATRGALVMKKGAVVAGRLALKPIALIAGSQLKMIGTGLTAGGTVVGATGAGIKKAGTAVKYAGLGSIGLGASAIGWGLDKTTIDKPWEETHKLFKNKH